MQTHRFHGDAIVGLKKLMYFCFDQIVTGDGDGETHAKSVAMSCPKVQLSRETKIHKCCPMGQILADSASRMDTCTSRPESSPPWRLPVNGHLYLEEDLVESGNLVYDSTRVQNCHNRHTFGHAVGSHFEITRVLYVEQ